MDSSNEWHSESKEGALMINQYQRDQYDYDSKLKKVGKEMMTAEDMPDEEKVRILQGQGVDIEKEQWDKLKELEDQPDSDDDMQQMHNLEEYIKTHKSRATFGKMAIETQMFSQEIDFEMFEKKFWGKNRGRIRISAVNAWTEIYSVIKGGMDSTYTFNYYLRKDVISWTRYKKMKSSMEYLDDKEKHQLYMIYLKYEEWKEKHHYYDFMDVVRHVFKFYPSWSKFPLDYLVVDEVQDLAPLTIQLLLLITRKDVFFCGDTAQTIAKGVTFRFHDLKPVFKNKDDVDPKVIQLTKNYRSHGKILELANSIVDIVELYFPHTIDKLQRESSDLDGPKPIILEGYNDEDLVGMVMNVSNSPAPKFGWNQVVIVRNQAVKSKLPLFLKKALCLTIYEAKGLEFEDVILYNFFNDSICSNQWRIIRDIEVYTEQRKKLRVNRDLTINELDLKGYNHMISRLEQEESKDEDGEEEYEEVTRLSTTTKREEVNRNFGLLCVELKYLYVAITRPKNRLIIYDSHIEEKSAKSKGVIRRNTVYEYWESLDLVDICHKGQEKDHPILAQAFEAAGDEAETKEQWRALGIKLFKKKFYDSVIQCFEKSGDEDLKIRTLGYMHAEEASSIMSEGENCLYAGRHNKALTKHEKGQKKREGKVLKAKAIEQFKIAGAYFEQICLYKNAAQCFFTCKNYEKAGEFFEEAKAFQQAAECMKMIGNFAKAAQMFEECGLYLKAFECFEYEKDWDGLLLCLNRNKVKFLPHERDSLINRYVPIALNSIYYIISEKAGAEDNKGKIMEEKYAKNKIDIIKEEFNSEEDSDEDTEQIQNITVKEETKDAEESEVSHIEENKKVDPSLEDEEEEQIVTTKAEQEKQEILSEEKVSSLNESNLSSYSLISKAELSQNFEHLSNFDPEDDFLKSDRSFSVIGSVLAKDEEVLSEYSDFSIVSNSRVSQIKGGSIIETDRDIYVEDMAMQKIIYYISLFSDDVKHYLTGLRSKDGLLQLDNVESSIDDFELELDNIDDDLVKIILDVLEHFDMFRLCLIVCNRYNMKEHISRYLTSICFKYSNLKLLDISKILRINEPIFRSNQKEVNILANEAIHSMLKLIDPRMMMQQKTETLEKDTKLMGAECWRYLFYLGFWKKLIYLMDTHSSLQL